MKNVGKLFENDFSKSVPDYVKLYRLPDNAQSFNQSSNLRFSRKNPFDYILWDSKHRILFTLELKTVAGKSISFERTKDEHGEIHIHQIIGLTEWSKYAGIVSGLVVEFRKCNQTIFLPIDEFNKLVDLVDKKSFNIDDLDKHNIQYFNIPQHKVRTRYRYDVDYVLNNIIKEI